MLGEVGRASGQVQSLTSYLYSGAANCPTAADVWRRRVSTFLLSRTYSIDKYHSFSVWAKTGSLL
jgi:hypothetical protein